MVLTGTLVFLFWKKKYVAVYVDIGPGASNGATIDFAFGNVAEDVNTRRFEILVTQQLCSSEMRPPDGCLQYFTEVSGRLKTFNFDAENSAHLQQQNYQICIRQDAGVYSVNSFL